MALAKFSPATAPPRINVYEIRPEPGVIGGAVNLTPNALRLFDRLGVLQIMKDNSYGMEIDAIEVFDIYQPVQMGESSFRGPNGMGIGEPPYKVSLVLDLVCRDICCACQTLPWIPFSRTCPLLLQG